jgi:hypothetical protein
MAFHFEPRHNQELAYTLNGAQSEPHRVGATVSCATGEVLVTDHELFVSWFGKHTMVDISPLSVAYRSALSECKDLDDAYSSIAYARLCNTLKLS